MFRNTFGIFSLSEKKGYLMKLMSPPSALCAGVALFFFQVNVTVANLPAFPGAEGFGAEAVGGRGGSVVKVTTLADSGPGSFREAVSGCGTTPARRIVVFEVSGIINLESGLLIDCSYLTIAGQTSPGGILVTGYQTTLNAHEVIIQHMRFRVGSHRIADGANPETLDSFDIWGNAQGHMQNDAYNIIIDHSSISWGVDENFSFAYNPRNITVQWSIISEGLSRAGHPKGEHSKGMLVWGKFSPDLTLSLHHNYFAHNYARNPMINGPNGDSPLVDVANNVVYSWFGGAIQVSTDHVRTNWRHSYARRGPRSNANAYEVAHGAGNFANDPQPVAYVEGNIGTHRLDQTADDWAVAIGWQYILQDQAWRRTTPWPVPPVTIMPMTEAVADCILTGVGATAPVRDSVDTRVVADFAAGTGDIIDNVTFPDDFPVFATPTPPVDSDNDGMPDDWENSQGLNNTLDDSAQDQDGDGYTNIEEYLHHLSARSYTYDATCMPAPASTTLPAAPSNLVASAVSSSQIDLSWTDNADDEEGFVIEYSIDGGTTFSELITVSANTTAYSNSGLAAQTTYHYRLFAYKGTGNSAYSNFSSATTPASVIADTTPPTISLLGANPQTITVGNAYNELGATANDDVDGDISTNIAIDASAVDTSTVGSYSVTYSVTDAAGNAATSLTRTVNVTASTPADTTPPTISLLGANPQAIAVGNAYNELGATANDNVDGDISADIVIDASAVDTSTVGSYSVTYSVTDAAGNAATPLTRTVNVTVSTSNEDTESATRTTQAGALSGWWLLIMLGVLGLQNIVRRFTSSRKN